MRNYLLAAVAAAAIATPAVARDGQAYVGVEGGLLIAKTTEFDMDLAFPEVDADDHPLFGPAGTTIGYDADVDYKTGVDLDVIAGYDFGMFRLEAELAWKSVHTKDIGANVENTIASDLLDLYDLDPADGTFEEQFGVSADHFLNVRDHARVASLMANALFDFNDGPIGLYAGIGAGRARVKMLGDKDNAFAYQGILGLRVPISDRVDAGLKYRYFRTGKLHFSDTLNYPNDFYGAGVFGLDARGRFQSHSLLASLIFNLGGAAPVEAPVVVAPPPPPPPATQTCPDGSVILATDVCPAPPPPPPAPSGERG